MMTPQKSTFSKRLMQLRLKEKKFVCDNRGRVLPILIVGVQKAGTTTMFDDLVTTLWLRTDIDCHMDGELRWPCKELGYFGSQAYQGKPYDSFWGSCFKPEQGLVADFTPENFHYPSIPKEMMSEYGSRSQNIVFLVGLREPLARMLAAFVNGFNVGWLYGHKRHLTFQDHVDEFLQMWDEKGQEEWIPTMHQTNDYRTVDQGLYYYKLRNFLDAGFLPSQFVIFPSNVYFANRGNLDTNPVLEAVRARLGKSVLKPTLNPDSAKVANRGSHRTVEEELPNKEAMRRLQTEVFGAANKRLMELLSENMREGMTLVGYSGVAGDVAAITQWMESQWNF